MFLPLSAPVLSRLTHVLLTCLVVLGSTLALAPAATAQEVGEPVTILLMGIDRRPDESLDEGVRPDLLAVLRLDPVTESCRLLSIPRDSRVEVPGYGMSKINHAYAFGGSDLAMTTVSNFLGIPLDHYAALDMDGAADLIDIVGGVTIAAPEEFTWGAYSYESSPQTLTGEQALNYAQYRDGPDGDFGRIRRQQQVLRSLLEGDIDLDVGKVLLQVRPLLADHFRSDLAIADILGLVTTYRTICTADTFGVDTLAGEAVTAYDEIYGEDLSMVITDPDDVAQKVRWLLGDE